MTDSAKGLTDEPFRKVCHFLFGKRKSDSLKCICYCCFITIIVYFLEKDELRFR